MKQGNIIRSTIFAAAAVEYPPSEMHLLRSNQVSRRAKRGALRSKVARGCASAAGGSMRGASGAWTETETVGGYTLTDRINGGVAEIMVQLHFTGEK